MAQAHHTDTQFDLPDMHSVYATHSNYELIDFDNDDDRCFVFCSSNALYYPNTPEAFRAAILECNRFEWKRNLPSFARRVILLRDVTKSWYLDGISADLNTIEKLLGFLTEQTRGMEIICVGSSAGGFAATMLGCLLNASHVFTFSGQYSLLPRLKNERDRALNPTLVKYEHTEEYRRYFSVVDLIAARNTPVFYFYPAKCPQDLAQSVLVRGVESVYAFPFDRSRHGSTCLAINYLPLFATSKNGLKRLHSHFGQAMVSPLRFSLRTSGCLQTSEYLLSLGIKRFRSRGGS